MSKEDITGQLDQLVEELEGQFPKKYSVDRLVQLRSTVATAKMVVEHLYDEAEREEHQDRKDGTMHRMVQDGRTMSDARDAVERGER